MNIHPEQREREIFVGNNMKIVECLNKLKTIRRGKIAYDVHGKVLTGLRYASYKPLFIGDVEIDEYNKIKMDQIKAI